MTHNFDLQNQIKGYLKTFGDKNPEKIFFVIWRREGWAGFFSTFHHVISFIKIAQDSNMIPIVDFQNFKIKYNEETPINSTTNSWEYYFEQLSPYSLEEVYSSKNVFFCDGEYPHDVWKKISGNKDEFRKIHDKFIKLNLPIKEAIEKYSHIFDNSRVLGVHFRGTDMNYTSHHPYGPTVKQMFKYTDKILNEREIDKIFLATDEQAYLNSFLQRYGSKVFHTDAFYFNKKNAYDVNQRKNHRYLLGLESVRDAILLSQCDGLLYSSSNISALAAMIGDHKFLYHINNGINSGNRHIAKYSYKIKKLLPKKLGGLLDEVKIT